MPLSPRMAARDAREGHHVTVASRWWRSGLCDNEHTRRVHVLRITVKVSSGIEHTTRKFVVDSNPQEHMRIINRWHTAARADERLRYGCRNFLIGDTTTRPLDLNRPRLRLPPAFLELSSALCSLVPAASRHAGSKTVPECGGCTCCCSPGRVQ